jgi:hypothetical protein
MSSYRFVRVFESGEEEALPAGDVMEAIRLAEEQGGLQVQRHGAAANDDRTLIEATGVMAVILQLSDMAKYRGCRIDAIEIVSPSPTN